MAFSNEQGRRKTPTRIKKAQKTENDAKMSPAEAPEWGVNPSRFNRISHFQPFSCILMTSKSRFLSIHFKWWLAEYRVVENFFCVLNVLI